ASKVVRLLAPAAAATLLTAPITAYAFGTVAPVGVLANLAAIPLAGIAVPGLMAALLFASTWLAAGAGLCLALLDLVAQTAAARRGAVDRDSCGRVVAVERAAPSLAHRGARGLHWRSRFTHHAFPRRYTPFCLFLSNRTFP